MSDKELNVVVEGVNEDFIWYESERLRADMNAWASRFEKLVKVAQERHKEHVIMLRHLMDENQDLKKKLKKKEKKK